MTEYVAVKSNSDFLLDASKSIAVWSRKGFSKSLKAQLQNNNNIVTERMVSDIAYSRLLSSLKRDALLFDKIYILRHLEENLSRELITELEWLVEKNIVSMVEPNQFLDTFLEKPSHTLEREGVQRILSYLHVIKNPLQNINTMFMKHKKVISQMQTKSKNLIKNLEDTEQVQEALIKLLEKMNESFVKNEYPFYIIMTRLCALILESLENIIATPLLSYASYDRKVPNSIRSNVVQIVISDLPLPDDNTPWEKIIEYRENQDNKNDLLSLRRWIKNLSAEDLSTAESKQELDWLKNEFQSHLNFHKIKANAETFEAIIKAPLEIMENLITLKFSKLPDPLFAIKKRQISLMEAELKAPGREIAYLIKSKQTFE